MWQIFENLARQVLRADPVLLALRGVFAQRREMYVGLPPEPLVVFGPAARDVGGCRPNPASVAQRRTTYATPT